MDHELQCLGLRASYLFVDRLKSSHFIQTQYTPPNIDPQNMNQSDVELTLISVGYPLCSVWPICDVVESISALSL